jgi:hypothetical protein
MGFSCPPEAMEEHGLYLPEEGSVVDGVFHTGLCDECRDG